MFSAWWCHFCGVLVSILKTRSSTLLRWRRFHYNNLIHVRCLNLKNTAKYMLYIATEINVAKYQDWNWICFRGNRIKLGWWCLCVFGGGPFSVLHRFWSNTMSLMIRRLCLLCRTTIPFLATRTTSSILCACGLPSRRRTLICAFVSIVQISIKYAPNYYIITKEIY